MAGIYVAGAGQFRGDVCIGLVLVMREESFLVESLKVPEPESTKTL